MTTNYGSYQQGDGGVDNKNFDGKSDIMQPPPVAFTAPGLTTSEFYQQSNYHSVDESALHCHTKDEKKLKNTRAAQRKLTIASIVCLFFMIGEFCGGYFSNSLAIMTDAAHLLSDFGSFMISLFALWLGTRKPSKKLSFGWHRAEVMGALLSVLIIWVLTGILVYEAIMRVKNEQYELKPLVMLITAGVGVIVNIIMGVTLHDTHGHAHGGGGHGHSHSDSNEHSHDGAHSHDAHSHDGHSHELQGSQSHGHSHNETDAILSKPRKKLKKDLNVRAAFIHVLGDLVQSVGVFLAALLIYFKPAWKIADPICTFMFSILVLLTTITILKDILLVLMEGTPKGLDFKEILEDLQNIRAVRMVHNLHVWSLTMGTPALSVHLAVDDSRATQSVLREAQSLVSQKYEIHHSTIQVEKFQEQMENCSLCEEPKD